LGRFHNFSSGIEWEGSFVRHYLNGEFFYRFSPGERSRIRETLVVNEETPWFYISNGNDTLDRVFALSIAEAVRYFGDSGQLADRELSEWWSGIYDEYNSARRAADLDGQYAYVWLRSRGGGPDLAAGIDGVGAISIGGTGVGNAAGRVRPVMWINLSETQKPDQ